MSRCNANFSHQHKLNYGGGEDVQANAFNWENFGFGNKNTAYRRPEFTLVFLRRKYHLQKTRQRFLSFFFFFFFSRFGNKPLFWTVQKVKCMVKKHKNIYFLFFKKKNYH